MYYDDKGSKSDEEVTLVKAGSPDDRDVYDEESEAYEGSRGHPFERGSGRTASLRSETPSSMFGFSRSVSSLSLHDPTLLSKLMNG